MRLGCMVSGRAVAWYARDLGLSPGIIIITTTI
jgi:hypothetical protein